MKKVASLNPWRQKAKWRKNPLDSTVTDSEPKYFQIPKFLHMPRAHAEGFRLCLHCYTLRTRLDDLLTQIWGATPWKFVANRHKKWEIAADSEVGVQAHRKEQIKALLESNTNPSNYAFAFTPIALSLEGEPNSWSLPYSL